MSDTVVNKDLTYVIVDLLYKGYVIYDTEMGKKLSSVDDESLETIKGYRPTPGGYVTTMLGMIGAGLVFIPEELVQGSWQ